MMSRHSTRGATECSRRAAATPKFAAYVAAAAEFHSTAPTEQNTGCCTPRGRKLWKPSVKPPHPANKSRTRIAALVEGRISLTRGCYLQMSLMLAGLL